MIRFRSEIPPGEFPISLLMEEYRLRHSYGDKPTLEEYRHRFPDQFQELAAQVSRQPVSSLSRLAIAERNSPDREGTPLPKSVEATRASNVPESPTQGELVAETKTPSAIPGVSDILPAEFQYRLIRRLGGGAFGEVYEALAPGGFRVAVKKILRAVDHPTSRGEIESLEAIKSMSHPFLLQTQAYWVFQDRLIIVMDLAEGSLADRIEHYQKQGQPGVPPEELIPFFEQAAEALDYLHSQSVSHRDVKPQNLLYLKGYAKVGDFGLARGHQHTMTIVGSEVGTPLYMAPEVWQQKVSLHSDQYSLAASYVRSRLGRAPFNGKTQYELMFQHLEETPDLNPLPEEEQEVILKAMAKKPEDRFPTCHDFAKALRRAVLEPPFAEPSPPPPRWRTAVLAAATALVCGLAIGGLGWYFQDRSVQVTEASIHLWLPPDWHPAQPVEVRADLSGKKYYRRLTRTIDGEELVLILIPKTGQNDPSTFYMLEKKITNHVFSKDWVRAEVDPCSPLGMLRTRNPGWAAAWIKGAWRRGAVIPNPTKPTGIEELGIKVEKAGVPVVGVTVPEAMLIAEQLGGLLPMANQYRKAVGAMEKGVSHGPAGPPIHFARWASWPLIAKRNLALFQTRGPWPISRKTSDLSVFGIHQLASNGFEWTGETDKGTRTSLLSIETTTWVKRVGQGWEIQEVVPLPELADGSSEDWLSTDASYTFRIILEPN
jgi:serine/threonine protein kinase